MPLKSNTVTIPDSLVVIGEAHSVEYITDRLSEDGEEEHFRHKFTTPVKVCLGDGCILLKGDGIGPTLDNQIEG